MMKSPQKFLLETKSELRKVSWPDKGEVYRLTFLVVVISLSVGLFLTGVDFVFKEFIEFLLKLKF